MGRDQRREATYTIRVVGASGLAPDIRREIELLSKHIVEHRGHYQRQHKKDVEVALEIVP
jgi:hypothetical protein